MSLLTLTSQPRQRPLSMLKIRLIRAKEVPLSYQIRVATASDHQAISALLLPLIEKFIAPDCSAEGTALLLGSMQPPPGPGLPLVGWQLGGADLRPAHFLGMHATQLAQQLCHFLPMK